MLCEVYFSLPHATTKEWPVLERIESSRQIRRTGHRMYHTTGFDREDILDLCIRINSVDRRAIRR